MSNFPQDQGKKVNNPLFSASVTGSTYEEFSQNAILLPAPALPSVVTSDQTQQIPSHLPLYTPEENIKAQESPSQILNVYNENQSSNTSQPPNVATGIVAQSTNLPIYQEPAVTTTPQVQIPLLYQAKQQITTPARSEVPNIQGSVNNYRRKNQKRPVYAPIPGLSSGYTPTISSNDTVSTCSQFNIIQNPFIPNVNNTEQLPKSTSPSLTPSSVSSQFQEISFKEACEQIQPPLNENSYFHPQLTAAPTDTESTSKTVYIPPLLSGYPKMEDLPNGGAPVSTIDKTHLTPIRPPLYASTDPPVQQIYRPAYHHWFHKQVIEDRIMWEPFSMSDSLALDCEFMSAELLPDKIVATDGGRYDVNILRREKKAVYWTGAATEVRRCSWFHKRTDGKYIPFEENIATKLEEEYKTALESRQWPKRVELSNDEVIMMHSQDVLVMLPPPPTEYAWPATNQPPKPKIVKRGLDEFEIDDGEPPVIDHLLFVVHGIGSKCDLKFRTVEQVVNDFREISLQLVKSHYRSSCEQGIVNRIEILPIRWHDQLHSEDTGIDKKLQSITLKSIPRVRNFVNETLLDIMFYNSPVYGQIIIEAVGGEMNRIYDLFKTRNPHFKGSVSLAGHSLGSLILFDILSNQNTNSDKENDIPEDSELVTETVKPPPLERRISKKISYQMGNTGTGQPDLHYPHLNFKPIALFAMGSPIGMYATVRGIKELGKEFVLPTCPAFFNIYHPLDPVVYRIEPLINPDLAEVNPVLIPHHKGRKRMHLELKDTMTRLGDGLKSTIMGSMRSTWNSFYQFAMFHGSTSNHSLEEQIDKVVEEQRELEEKEQHARQRTLSTQSTSDEEAEVAVACGLLNQGKRMDYVLQQSPIEMLNEYLFAVQSHLCYWQSEDTILFVLKALYNSMNVTTDSKIPQQTMTIERAPAQHLISPTMEHFDECDADSANGTDPTMPISHNAVNIGPPPTAGFFRKTE